MRNRRWLSPAKPLPPPETGAVSPLRSVGVQCDNLSAGPGIRARLLHPMVGQKADWAHSSTSGPVPQEGD